MPPGALRHRDQRIRVPDTSRFFSWRHWRRSRRNGWRSNGCWKLISCVRVWPDRSGVIGRSFLEFHTDGDCRFVADDRHVLAKSKIGPLHRTLGVEAHEGVFAGKRVATGAVKRDIERDRFGDVVHRQVAGHLEGRGARTHHVRRGESHPGVVFRVEELVGKQLPVQLTIGGLNLGDRYFYADLRRANGPGIEGQGARRARKCPPEFREAHVVDSVADQGLLAVDVVGTGGYLVQRKVRWMNPGSDHRGTWTGCGIMRR